jgi:endogenous inhibitor of DNA gyrase (YacG/DUF329 family)
MPFCSARCKQIDLGKWLFEEYRLPSEETRGDDDEETARATPTQEME